MAELLMELFSEEIPARLQARAASDLAKLVQAELAALVTSPLTAFAGPRRLTVVGEISDFAQTAPKEERGPRVGAPDAAVDGFLRKHAASRSDLTQQGQFWVLVRPATKIAAYDAVAAALPAVLPKLAWPKSMRWGTLPFPWIRPLRRVLCLLGGECVAVGLPHGLTSGQETEGHRVMAPGAFAVTSFDGYRKGLKERRVVLDGAERARLIREGIASLAAAEALKPLEDEDLVAEVAGLVEWPVPLLGSIDAAFMDLPPEVMRTTMRVNQRYFMLTRPDGGLASRFALVANLAAEDGGAAIIAGNERVLRARLSDARFFWDQDRRVRLESFLPRLETVVFHAKLGTQGARVARLKTLAVALAKTLGVDPASAERAASLAKADLASGMVGEFPELQGVMGSYYAAHQGEPEAVARAIAEHYRPAGTMDTVPSELVSVVLGIADRLDQLVSFFAVDERPTGSGDPYALRRAALGIIRLVRANRLRLPLRTVLRVAAEMAPTQNADALAAEVLEFLLERLRVQLRSEGGRHDIFNAVSGSAAASEDDLIKLLDRGDALQRLLETEDGSNLLAAYRRAANILKIEDRKDGPHTGPFDRALLADQDEVRLADLLGQVEPQVADALQAERPDEAMAALATLRPAVDRFFANIMVNDPQPQLRLNRLRLLARLRDGIDLVGDLSRIDA